jgi:hypothetical protein
MVSRYTLHLLHGFKIYVALVARFNCIYRDLPVLNLDVWSCVIMVFVHVYGLIMTPLCVNKVAVSLKKCDHLNVSAPQGGPGGCCPGRAPVFHSEGSCTSCLYSNDCLSFPYRIVGDEYWHHWWCVSVPPVCPITGKQAQLLILVLP